MSMHFHQVSLFIEKKKENDVTVDNIISNMLENIIVAPNKTNR